MSTQTPSNYSYEQQLITREQTCKSIIRAYLQLPPEENLDLGELIGLLILEVKNGNKKQ